MKNLFISYELAIKLKEKGFEENCISLYFNEKLITSGEDKDFNKNHVYYKHGAILYQQVTDWFREKHNISIEVTHNVYKNVIEKFGKYSYDIKYIDDNPIKKADSYGFGTNDYYETLKIAIENAIKEI